MDFARVHKLIILPVVFLITLGVLTILVNKGTLAAGYGWHDPSYSGSNAGCGAWKSPVTVVLLNPAGASLSGFIEAYVPGAVSSVATNGSSLYVGCVDVRVGYWVHARVGGYHEAWKGPSYYDPPADHAQKNITDRFYLLSNASGPSININGPAANVWTNQNPNWLIYAVPSPGHSRIEAVGLFLWNFTTGTAPCNLCIWTGSWAAGTVNHGQLSIPDGWYARGAQARDEIVNGVKGVTVWGEGKHHWRDGTDYSYFGLDRVGPVVISTNHDPSTVYSTQTVDLIARARDQSNLSGLNWIQTRYQVNGGAYTTVQSPGYAGAYDRTFTITRGPWATGTQVCFEARARDMAGNQSDWAGRRCFTVLKGADLVVSPIGNYGEFHVGDPIPAITLTVTNTGKQNAGGFYLEFCKNGTAAYNCNIAWSPKWWVASLNGGAATSRVVPSFAAPDPGVYPTTYTLVARADLDLGTPGRVREEVELNNNRVLGYFTVIGPPPWFQTKKGDVGSRRNISPTHSPPGSNKNADFLVIADTPLISNFYSAVNWLVKKYSDYGGINLKPALVSGSIYDAFAQKYKSDTATLIGDLNAIPAVGGNRVYRIDGSLAIPGGGVNYNKEKAIVFIKEHMEINGNLEIAPHTGIIFVVNEWVRVKNSVTRTDGIYVFDGNYDVQSKNNKNEDKLTVFGSVIGAFSGGSFNLSRDFRGVKNKTEPTELFIYEPKYLWLFKEILGDKKVSFKEVAP